MSMPRASVAAARFLTVQVDQDQAGRVEEIFLENGAVGAAARGEAYRHRAGPDTIPPRPPTRRTEISREREPVRPRRHSDLDASHLASRPVGLAAQKRFAW